MWQPRGHRITRAALVGLGALALAVTGPGARAAPAEASAALPSVRQPKAPALPPLTIAGRRVLAVYTMQATAYGPEAEDNYPYGPTNFFGRALRPGTVAVDPHTIPLGSTVYVTGYRDPLLPPGGFVGRALDTGHGIVGARIDIYLAGSAEAVNAFGEQKVAVFVLGPPQAGG